MILQESDTISIIKDANMGENIMLTRLEKFYWTIMIKVTKSEELVSEQQKHIEISNAYQKEYVRRKKVFLPPDDVR